MDVDIAGGCVMGVIHKALWVSMGCVALFGLPAHGADWLVVAKDKVRSVELDRASMVASDGGTRVAWGRIVVSDEQAPVMGYKTLNVLNRYDCTNRSFTAVKRVYFSADATVLREEPVEKPTQTVVRPGTADERFYKEVCPEAPAVAKKALLGDGKGKALSLRDLGRIVQEANQRAEQARKKEGDGQRPFRRAGLQFVKEEQASEAQSKPVKKTAGAMTQVPQSGSPQASRESVVLPAGKTPDPYHVSPVNQPRRPLVSRRPPVKSPTPVVVPQPPLHHPYAHWSYEGDTGPANWGKLRTEYSQCASGTRQSPIDIRDGIKVEQEAIVFDYKPSYFRILDNGHSIQVNYGPGSQLGVMGRNFELVQFHFHRPSEERIDGRSFDMVIHLVHKDLDGRLAVLAVMLKRGEASPFIQTLWNNLPLEKNEDYLARVPINAIDVIPSKRDYYSYMGSLTTPPCTEGVLWLVMKQPVTLSEEQIAVFSRFYRNNVRPIQPTNGRVIKESR